MSPPNRPSASLLPGINNLSLTIDSAQNTADFVDKKGTRRTLRFCLWSNDADKLLTIMCSDESMCSFTPCPSPNGHLWFAPGLKVIDEGCWIASYMYALARDLLMSNGGSITPSGNLFSDGVGLWSKLDPNVEFQEQKHLPGFFEPI
jgi:hypothetical protein